MSAQTVKKTGAAAAPLATIKPAAGVPAIAPDSDKQLSYWREQAEDFLTELNKLRCLSGLLNGQNENASITLSELCYLIDPSVDRLKDICDELSDLFYREQVAFLQAAGGKGSPLTLTDTVVFHEHGGEVSR